MRTKINTIVLILWAILVAGSVAYAADVQVQLDNSSNPGFSVSNSSGVGVDRIDSNGNVGIGTTTALTLLYVSPQGMIPTFATPADAYIQNNLEVDGVTYLTSVQASGGYTQSGDDFNIFTGNIGIGTSTPNSELSVLGGASFGSYATIAAPAGGIITSGNVGIASFAPGEALDVQGGIRSTALTMSGQTPVSGYVLTATDSNGDTTWSTPGLVGGWTVSGNNVYETNMGNVGIGTTTVNGGALVVTNGNVGIGTWAPGQLLDVVGETRTTAFTMSGQTPISGYVLTASDSSGDTTWSSPGTVGGWTVSGNNVYETSNGNVGIGTSSVSQGSLVVTNGNVGIGTWVPAAPLTVGANAFTVNSAGTITATTGITTSGAYTQSGLSPNTLSGLTTFSAPGISASFVSNVGIGSTAPGQALDVNGTIRTVNFTMSGQTPISGYVLTASDSSGDTTWSSPGTVGGWTVSGNNVYETSSGNVGIGTSTVNQGALVITNGNVGIGTWAPNTLFAVGANAFTVNSVGAITAMTGITTSGAYTQSGLSPNTLSGLTTFSSPGISASFVSNVGIGSTAPGQALDVNGTIRTVNFTMSGQTPISGYVLTASDSSGDTTWSSPGTVGGWTVSGNNVYETSSGNVGIGTSTVNQGALVVTNGNVGIGTWVPAEPLTVGANAFTVNSAGTITATTGITTSGAYTQSGNSTNTLSGLTTFSSPGISASFVSNVGIGSTAPGQALDVNGTIRTVNFTMSGQTPISGYVLTASDSSGDTTWSSPGTVGGWTVSGNNVYETSSGNVGIGTSTVNQAALVVTNGNVGIGTWTAANQLSVVGSAAIGSTIYTNSAAPANGLIVSGNVGLGTWIPNAALAVGANAFTVNSAGTITATTGITTSGAYTQSGNSTNTLSGLTTFSSPGISASFVSNVGIGSTAPGQALDVNGTIRTVNFTMSGQTPVSGYVLTASDSNGDATWSSLAQISGWTVSGNNLYETSNGNVGIGTSTVTQGALVITNGNVGIGTWAPNSIFAVGANAFTVNNAGAITATTGITTTGAYTQSGNSSNTLSGLTTFSAPGISASFVGNVGIGSTAPGQALDVNGTIRTVNFTMSGQTPISGYVLTASDSSGDTTWSSPGTVGGWTVSGNNVYETSSGNVGIGTTTVTQGALVITNGNVGIGTWAPNTLFAVGANAFTVNSAGTITATTGITTSGAYTQSGNGINAFTGNIGVGTTAPQGSLVVTNGNVGIGTWAPTASLVVGANAFTVNSVGVITATTGITTSGAYTQSGFSPNTLSGLTTFSAPGISASFVSNVGIGSTAPGQALDVNGTIRTVNFTMSGQTPISGYVLTASDSEGDTTWSSPGDVSGWTIVGNNVYETSSGNVGIGTTTVNQGALVVTNGNVGIGTWAPSSLFAVGKNAFTINNAGAITAVTGITTTGAYTQSGNGINAFTGNIGVGTTTPQTLFSVVGGNVGIGTWTAANPLSIVGGASIGSAAYASTAAPANGLIVSGNVGIGSTAPGQALDVNGTIRTINFTMSGQTPISGYVLIASDSEGDTTWSSPGDVSGWTVSGNNVYETSSGNVGIGTTTVNQGALVVTNGNVGIGTWAPNSIFAVGANAFTVNNAGVITAVTGITTSGAYTQSGSGINAFTGNIGVGTTTPQGSLVVTNGNVGIGTWAPSSLFAVGKNAFTINNVGTITAVTGITTTGAYTQSGNGINAFTGNVGIGSLSPGQALDVNGTIRTVNFTMSGQTPISGYVLTASDSEGDTTWSSPGDVSGWTIVGNNVYETSSGNVGIGTSSVTQGALVVTNGNVGIGTWVPTAPLAVGANAFTVNNAGAITATTGITTSGAYTQSGNGINAFTGNIGVGTTAPQGSLVVTNGNVGIGTWVPTAPLAVGANAFTVNNAGTITATTGITTTGAYTQSGLSPNTLSGLTTFSAPGISASFVSNVGIGSTSPGQALDVNGTIRTVNFTMSGQTPVSGYVLTASDSNGDTTWSSPGTIGGWTISGNNVYETSSGNVGIGTSSVTQGALVITNGNVGIGTWAPINSLDINNNAAIGANYAGVRTAPANGLIVQGNVGFGTFSPQTGLAVIGNVGIGTWTAAGGSLIVMNGNVGIGTNAPPVLFAAGVGSPIHATAANDSYFGHDVEVEGVLYATTVIGAESLSGDLDLGGYFLTSKTGTGNGTVSISGGTGADSSDLIVAPNHFVGIGTTTPGSRLTVNGGEAIGTSLSYLTTLAPPNGLMVQGNVGIGSLSPGQALDVNGTIRTVNFTMSGQTPISGYVLTASDSSGDTTWSSPGTVGGWTVSGNNVYETSSGNVGIGTSSVTQGALVVTNGNVGIGTWTPSSLFAVGNNAFTINNAGTITAVTGITTTGAYTQSGLSPNTLSGLTTFSSPGISASFVGNVGIGSTAPGQALDVNGTIRTVNFTMSGQTPISGYVLTASDSSGDTTWSSPGTVGGWTVSGNNVYETSSGNVGIGTSSVTQGALVVTNGNVGIGTWAPSSLFAVGKNVFTINNAGAITAVTGITTTGAYTQSGNGINAFTGNVGVGTTTPQTLFSVVGGNVGIGTWTAANPLSIVGGASIGSAAYASTAAPANGLIVSGNVGIGSTAPGQALDVNGTIRTINFTMSGQTPVSGYVLTASDSSGDATWSSPGTIGGWTESGNNVYETSSGNVGIGTTTVNQGALVVTNGNVGIGTWAPNSIFAVGANAFTVNNAGVITAVTGITTSGAYTQSGSGINAFTGNIGVGTTTPQGSLVVTNGNVGIGTWAPSSLFAVGKNAFTINNVGAITAVTGITTTGAYTQSGNGINAFTGNVGIGSLSPGQALDVNGTIRTVNFTMSGQTPISGYVLTASDSEGDTTWSSPGNVSGWTIVGNNVYETSSGNVGIGTSSVTQGALVVTNGNVGIGTWVPTAPLAVGANAFTVNNAGAITATTGITTSGAYTQSGNGINAFTGNIGVGTTAPQGSLVVTNGNVGIGTWVPTAPLAVGANAFTVNNAGTITATTGITTTGAYTQSGNGINAFTGNVGIGSLSPGQALDVNGTIRTVNFTMSGQTPISGYVLTASDSSGDTTWSSPGTVSGWTVSGNNVYETSSGNVGIGTSSVTQGALVVTNGNVGIGTWAPINSLDINNNAAIGANYAGVRTAPANGLIVQGNVGFGTFSPQTGLAVIGNVGIGTWTAAGGSLIVMNGNVGIGTNAPPVLFAAGVGSPIHATAANDSYFGHDVEVEGILYATTVVGAEDLAGDLDLGGYFLTSKTGTGNGTVSISGGTGADSSDLIVAPNHFVGIGTTTPGSRLTVNGGEAIGTSLSYLTTLAPPNGLMVQGNVGIGSLSPGQALDVNGTIRTVNFTMSGQTPISGYVLTASDSSGDTTWSSPGTVGGWTVSGNNVYETSSGNVGIGTSSVTQGALVVTNGNVGIGTWTPSSLFAVGNNAFTINNAGTITAVTGITTTGAYTQSGLSPNTLSGLTTFSSPGISASFVGNVGIGSTAPGQALDVNGTIRTVNFTMSGQTPISGYVLTASDSSGDTTWSSPGTVGGWTVSGNNVYETSSGNVGIGTSSVTQGALVVTNGNVGIGTWAPSSLFAVGKNVFTINNAGAITAVTGITTTGAYTQSGNGINAFTGNVGVGTTTPQTLFSVVGGNVGIGTWTAAGGSLIVASGNVGIGSTTPGTALDVNGTVRMTGFTLNQNPSSGYVLVGNGVGVGTWMPPASFTISSQWSTVNVNDVYLPNNGNVGIGTSYTNAGAALTVMNGNVGIGTWAPNAIFAVGKNAFTINSAGAITAVTGITTTGAYTQSGLSPNTLSGLTTFSALGTSASFVGNVGIGSTAPGQALDVNGTIRTVNFTMSGQTPISGYVLTASDSSGDTTWSSPGTVGGWTVSGNNVYETSGGNVGIGTTIVNQAALTVMNGNVGIGTWVPGGALIVMNGNVGIGTSSPLNMLDVSGINGGSAGIYLNNAVPLSTTNTLYNNAGTLTWNGNIRGAAFGQFTSGLNTTVFNDGSAGIVLNTNSLPRLFVSLAGNVGIGSLSPGQTLDVTGTIRTIGFTMSGQTPISGYVLTASDSSGDTTWSSPGTVGGWTVSGNNVYETSAGNVGIGTSALQTAFAVTNGNVGIGTWTAAGGNLIINGGGNVGIGSAWPGTTLDVQGTVRAISFIGNGAGLTGISGAITGLTPGYVPTASSSTTIVNGNIYNVGQGSNVGIGSTAPGQTLDVNGTIRTVNFTMSGQTPISGYVLTASDSSGDTTWSSPGTVGGWTVSGNNVYETSSGNVGIGTSTVTQGALVVTNGNVGIGTWAPSSLFAVGKNTFTINNAGTITAVTGITTTGAYTQSGNGINAFTGNIGVGTTAPQGSLVVTNGNVGIGTWVPTAPLAVGANAFTVNNAGTITATTGITTTGAYTQSGLSPNTLSGLTTFSAPGISASFVGNVGIGSTAPGQALDVNGTIRTVNFTMSGQTPISGYVLTASDSSGDTTWSSPGTVGGWTVSGNNVYETSSGNVGIGTSSITQGALVVTNGNVGIGTWVPASLFQVNQPSGSPFVVNSSGKVGIGTTTPQGALVITNGNVGIGTWAPINSLDINNNAAIGANYAGVRTAPANGLIVQGNVGFGTFSPQTGLAVIGNVGIGTWTAAGGSLIVMNGNVGIGTNAPPVLFAAGVGAPVHATAANDSYFGHDVEVEGVLYATTIVGAQELSGDFDLGGYFITSKSGNGNGTVSISGGTGADSSDLIVAPNHFVGIGTTTPGSRLTVDGGEAIGTSLSYLTTLAPPNGLIVQGNVGIGSLSPGQALDVNGTIRTVNFTMSGQTPISGYVLTASDSSGDATWSSPGTVGGWTVSGNNVYETSSGNVGIGTSSVTQGALVVTNGNVGIGTWAPQYTLDLTQNANSDINAALILVAGAELGNNNGLIFGSSGSDEQIAGSAGVTPYTLFFGTGGNTQMVIQSSNVGIGTSAPVSKLNVNGGVGIGTTLTNGAYLSGNSAPSGGLIVQNNVGIGTFNPFGGNLIVNGGGNVGIGSLVPGTALDVNGTVRMTGLTLNQNPGPGYVLVGNGVGVGTWMAASTLPGTGASNYWLNNVGSNVGISTTYAVGIGTSFVGGTGEAALSVMNGNVGIGTWIPNAPLAVGTNAFTVNNAGAITATTGITTSGAYTQSGNNANTLSGLTTFSATAISASFVGNVGIGSTAPGQALDVNGTIRTVNFTMSGQTPISGYVLTASDSSGDTTWSSPGTVGGWTVSGNNVYETSSGNVGIGTSSVTQGALVVTNGNVGIGTWTPSSLFAVGNNTFTINNAGAITAVTGITTTGAYTQSGNGINAFTGNVGIGTFNPFGGNLIVNGGGNVGIGSLVPGTALDVNGTVRMTGFTLNQNPSSGYVLVGNGVGIGTWMAASTLPGTGTSNYWLNNVGSNVGINTTYAVGIGTSFVGGTGEGAFTVMNGNVGIGTWLPAATLDVNGSLITTGNTGNTTLNTAGGNVGIGSANPGQELDVAGVIRGTQMIDTGVTASSLVYANASQQLLAVTLGNGLSLAGSTLSNTISNYWALAGGPGNVGISTTNTVGIGTIFGAGAGLVVMNGNVGIGTWVPGMELDVNGTVRMTGLTMSGQTPISGYVLTASDSSGDTTWTSPGTVGGWTVSGNNVYETSSGNVGIGTSSVTQGALVVTNGNVGIGTWVPTATLDVNGNFIVTGNTGNTTLNTTGGNVGIGSASPGQELDVFGNIRGTQMIDTGVIASSLVWANANQQLAPVTIGSGLSLSVGGTLSASASGNYWSLGLGGAGNVGISTANTVGIGTTLAGNGAGLVVMNGNVGIGTWVPGVELDVNGTARVTGFTLNQNPGTGYVLVGNGVGVGTWMPASTLTTSGGTNYWLNNVGSNVGINTTYAVGIGTSFVGGTGEGAFTVMNGNVGIGTWVPTAALAVGANAFTVSTGGNVGIGNNILGGNAATENMIIYNNTDAVANLGTDAGVALKLVNSTFSQGNGTAVGIGFAVTGNPVGTMGAEILHIRQGSNSYGDLAFYTKNSGGTLAERMRLNSDGNVGIGTFNPFGGGLIVTNGNVGIGSLTPGQVLDVNGTVRMTGLTLNQSPGAGYVLVGNGVGVGTWMPASTLATSGTSQWVTTNVNDVYLPNSGNVGIGTTFTSAGGALDIMNGNVGIGTWAPTSTFSISGSFAVRTIVPGSYPYTAATNDQVILASASSGNVVVNLPAVSSVPGREYVIKKTDATANIITIQAHGADTIDGQNTVSMAIQYQSYTIVSDGTNWDVL